VSAISIRSAEDGDVRELVELWQACGLTRAHNDAPTDIAFARRHPNSDVLVAMREGRIVASAMVGHDGHRGIVYYVSVAPELRGEGLGRAMMEAAERWLIERGIWKLNLLVRGSNRDVVSFYQSVGYVVEDSLCLSKRLQPMPHIDPEAPR
jgi:hypothetical protein